MDLHAEPGDGIEGSLKATYRALLARGLEAGEAANLTAFLHGLPSAGFQWTLPEIQAILRRRIAHAADQRAAAGDEIPSSADAHLVAHHAGTAVAASSPSGTAQGRHPNPHHPSRRSTIHDRRRFTSGSTHVIDLPNP